MIKVLFKQGESDALGMHVRVDKAYTGTDLETVKAQFMNDINLMFDAITDIPTDKSKSYWLQFPVNELVSFPREYILKPPLKH